MLADKPLVSAQLEVEDLDDAIELYYRKGWTDGLPVVPPTEEKVRRFLAAAGREPEEVLGFYSESRRQVTVEKVAINAVMAGCLPEYFPVVLAIVEAMLERDFTIHAANSSTSGIAVGFIVNGPIRNKLGMNCWGNVLGPGNRANSTIGRAVRLTQINVMGSIPGAGGRDEAGDMILDRSTMGQPGKYAGYHIVENEEAFPSLLPLHVELGFPRESSVVTVLPTAGHVQMSVHAEHSGEQTMDTIARNLVGPGRLNANRYYVVILSPENAGYLVRDGWSKADVRNGLYQRTSRNEAWLKEQGWIRGSASPGDEQRTRNIVARPEDFYIVVAGGPAGAWVDFLFSFGGLPQSKGIRT